MNLEQKKTLSVNLDEIDVEQLLSKELEQKRILMEDEQNAFVDHK